MVLMAFFSISEVLRLVGQIAYEVSGKNTKLCSTGPIFDAYGPAYVVIPGSVGIVVAVICLSFSEGTCF